MKILIADDEYGIRRGLNELFTREGYEVLEAPDLTAALELSRRHEFSAALIDIRLGDDDGTALLKALKENGEETVCLMITGYGSIRGAVEAMQNGAADYLLKPLDNAKVLEAVRSRLELNRLRHENSRLKTELRNVSTGSVFICSSPRMRELRATADRVKNTDATVLITGPSGAGKEVLCRYIHDTGDRAGAPFIGVNCAALSDSLLLSELFGHEKGAFTGAAERKPGKFELADGGTLFLDEIGDMSSETQAKLLRVIEQGAFERVGGTRLISVDVRLIAATNQNLEELVAERRFREDLYYRLNVVRLEIPPLAERTEEIPELARHFVEYYSGRYRKELAPPSDAEMEQLIACPWSGNVRELKNMINQAVLLSEGDRVDLSPCLRSRGVGRSPEETASLPQRIAETAESQERELIEKALVRHRYNRTAAAEELGITRRTLFNKINRYGL